MLILRQDVELGGDLRCSEQDEICPFLASIILVEKSDESDL